jgi:hypothetical protein
MTLNKPAVYGLYPHDAALPEIVRTLNDAGFGNQDICMMLSPTHPIATIVRDANILNEDREEAELTAECIGWLSEFGAVLIPTIGFFIRSRAFFQALLGAKHSPALCGRSRSLAALGFQRDKAERFEDQLRRDGVLMYVSCPESDKTDWAVELLHRTGAREAATLEREMAAEAVA